MDALTFTPRLLGQAENTLRALLTRFLAGTDLTYHTWVLMNATAMSGGEADRGQLTATATNALKIDQADVDSAIVTLTQAGLVTADAQAVRLTEAGRTVYQRVSAAMSPATSRLLADVPTEDLAAAGRVLSTLIDRANAILAAA
jgi:DNA-binding MarR family transcriptional regulator